LERLQRVRPGIVPAETPFALVETSARGVVLTAVTRAAAAVGLQAGMSLADARAVCPHVRTRPAEPEADRSGLLALARWCVRYAPARNVEGCDGLWIDITGAAHLLGGEEALARDLAGRAARQGLGVRIGIADTHGAARALARFAAMTRRSPFVIAEPGLAGTDRALAELPVAGLGLDGETLLLLRRLGLTRIGQLVGLPRSALEKRFRRLAGGSPTLGGAAGADMPGRGRGGRGRGVREGCGRASGGRAGPAGEQAAGLLLRLDRVRGLIADPHVPLSELAVPLARRVPLEPLVSAAAVEETVRQLVVELTQRLAQSEQGVRHVTLILERVDGGRVEIGAGTSLPCREAGHLLGLLRERVERIDAGFGIDTMTLVADRVERLAGKQQSLLGIGEREEGPREERFARLLDRLLGRLGSERVLVPVLGESHVPERAGRLVPVAGMLGAGGATGGRSVEPGGLRRGRRGGNRPAFLLAPPEPIEVLAEVSEGAPMRFTWRRAVRAVAKAEGPERIAPEWWLTLRAGVAGGAGAGTEVAEGNEPGAGVSGPASFSLSRGRPRVRDYYRLEDGQGRGYWVYREGLYTDEEAAAEGEGPPRWFVHGVFA
jgi:protein ImuB